MKRYSILAAVIAGAGAAFCWGACICWQPDGNACEFVVERSCPHTRDIPQCQTSLQMERLYLTHYGLSIFGYYRDYDKDVPCAKWTNCRIMSDGWCGPDPMTTSYGVMTPSYSITGDCDGS